MEKDKKVLDSGFCIQPPTFTSFHLLSPIFYPHFAQKYIKRANDIIENRNADRNTRKENKHEENRRNKKC